MGSTTAEPVLLIDGRGNGHGVGMSQDGALAMGRAGAGTEEILAKFYPGTEGSTAGGVVGVRVLESAATRVEVAFPGGGEVRAAPDGPQPDGFPVTIRSGGSVTVLLDDGTFRAEPDEGDELEVAMPPVRLIAEESVDVTPSSAPPEAESAAATVEEQATTTTTTTEGTTTTTVATDSAPPSTAAVDAATTVVGAPSRPGETGERMSSADGLWLVPADGSTTSLPGRDREYRGVVEVSGSSLGGLLLVNRLDVEDYLKGMGEVLDPSWPPAALRAQAIAARTYALRATRSGGTLCDDDRCQVYLGADAEYPAMDDAVDESAGQVVAYGGGLASTVYSASAGGVTATPREGFGTDGSDFPYLTSASYAASDTPVWSSSVALDDVGARLGYPGRVRGAAVTAAGPSGRVLEVVLDGDAGPRVVDGLRFATRLNLDSTLFSLRTTIGTPSRPPAPGAGSIQAPPDAAARLPPVLEPVSDSTRAPDGPELSGPTRSALLLAAAALLLLEKRRRRAARTAR